MSASTDDTTRRGKVSDLRRVPATELAARIRGREIASVEAVDTVLQRSAALNPHLTVFRSLHADEARSWADRRPRLWPK